MRASPPTLAAPDHLTHVARLPVWTVHEACRHMDLKERVRGCTTGDVQAGAQTTETTPICAPLSPLVQPHSDVLPRANVCHHHMPISVYEPSGLHSNNAYYSESSAPHSLDSVLPLDSLDDSTTGGAAVYERRIICGPSPTPPPIAVLPPGASHRPHLEPEARQPPITTTQPLPVPLLTDSDTLSIEETLGSQPHEQNIYQTLYEPGDLPLSPLWQTSCAALADALRQIASGEVWEYRSYTVSSHKPGAQTTTKT